jgi:predicted GIY-YIG superfamily endonuclease
MGFFGNWGRKKKSGSVYIGAVPSGKLYTGSTTRSVRTRVGEHIKEVNKPNSKTWVGRQGGFRLMGSIPSKNPRKAERTIKSLSSSQKRYLARQGARRYKSRYYY